MTGLDGNYRITCHTVMEVLREHRDSVMAVLEAFVYDPLLNWRLMDSKDPFTSFPLHTYSKSSRWRERSLQLLMVIWNCSFLKVNQNYNIHVC